MTETEALLVVLLLGIWIGFNASDLLDLLIDWLTKKR